MVKNPPASPGDLREAGSIPGSGRCPGGGHSHPLQYSRLENPMDRGASWATVHSVAKSWTQLKRLRDSAPECVSRSPQKMSPGQVLGPNWVVALPFLSLSSFLTPADFTSQHRVDELHWDHLLLLIKCSGHQPTRTSCCLPPSLTPPHNQGGQGSQPRAALIDQVEPPPGSMTILPDHHQQSLHQTAGLTRGSGPMLRSAFHAPAQCCCLTSLSSPPLVSAPTASCPHLAPASLFPLSPSLLLPPLPPLLRGWSRRL